MDNQLAFKGILKRAFTITKKRYLPQFSVALIVRVIGVIASFVILIGAIFRMMSVNVLDIPTEGTVIMGGAVAMIVVMLIFIDIFVTATISALGSRKLGQALKAVSKKMHRIIVSTFIVVTAYFLVIFVVYVILGLIWSQFSPIQLAAMITDGTNHVILFTLAVVGMFFLLLVNNTFLLLIPRIVDDSQPFLTCIDDCIRIAFKKGIVPELTLFNVICKLFIIIFYSAVYFVISAIVELPAILRAPEDFDIINNVMIILFHVIVAYLIGTVIIPVSKNLICALKDA